MIELQPIALTLSDGSPIAIVVAHITCWQASDDGTLIGMTGGGCEQVNEDFDVVSEMLNPEQQAGC